ncbi:MAG: endonuclease III [Chloroflexi bacterium]|nr:endonuclease III [Chloroflexota bacterium]
MNPREEKAAEVYARLTAAYGTPDWRPQFEPVDELILTILSANTNDRNSLAAFETLKARFDGDWDAVRNAPLAEIKDAIRVAGMYNQKAPRIVESLEKLCQEVGKYSLDHLAGMPVDEALNYLQSFPGVGHKTASIVLLFCFRKPTFPVDTHIQRQSQRLGISRAKASPLEVKREWETLLPDADYYSLHLNLIRHGREVCDARAPRCDECVLRSLCEYAKNPPNA